MWLSDLRIILPDQTLECGSLCLENGRIVEIIEGSVHDASIVATGLTAIPGIIDIYDEMLQHEIEPQPGKRFPTDMVLLELDKHLAAAGVTTAYATLVFREYTTPDHLHARQTIRDLITTLHTLRQDLLVGLHVHACFEVSTPGIAPLLVEMLAAEQVDMVSLMDHTLGHGQYGTIDNYVDFIVQWRSAHRADGEDGTTSANGNVPAIAANWERARGIVGIARRQGLPIASYDDDTVAKVDLMASLGVVLCEFPLTLEAAQEARANGMYVVMRTPSMLPGSAVADGFHALEAIKLGLVDILASDYYPATLLHTVFWLAQQSILPLHEAVKLVGQNPAAALGLYNCGSIEVGKHADLVLVEPTACPRVRGTIRRGVPIYWDGYLAGLGSA